MAFVYGRGIWGRKLFGSSYLSVYTVSFPLTIEAGMTRNEAYYAIVEAGFIRATSHPSLLQLGLTRAAIQHYLLLDAGLILTYSPELEIELTLTRVTRGNLDLFIWCVALPLRVSGRPDLVVSSLRHDPVYTTDVTPEVYATLVA